jgi:TAP-like protein
VTESKAGSGWRRNFKRSGRPAAPRRRCCRPPPRQRASRRCPHRGAVWRRRRTALGDLWRRAQPAPSAHLRESRRRRRAARRSDRPERPVGRRGMRVLASQLPGAYQGPWVRPTPPIFVIGNTMDPSTPYSGSVTMARQLANARLLTVQGHGHTEFLNPSTCAANYGRRRSIQKAPAQLRNEANKPSAQRLTRHRSIDPYRQRLGCTRGPSPPVTKYVWLAVRGSRLRERVGALSGMTGARCNARGRLSVWAHGGR